MVIVSLCTNDNHGNDTGHVSAIDLGEAIDLQWAEIGHEPRYSIEQKVLTIQRKKFAITGRTEWLGNWCWTGVSMVETEAARLLNHLSKDTRWHCEGGWCDLTEAYESGDVIPENLEGVQ